MSFTNPPVDEQVNLPQENPLFEFSWMLFAVGLLTIVLAIGVSLGAHWLVRYIPIEYEAHLIEVSGVLQAQLKQAAQQNVDPDEEQRRAQTQTYLQQLADALVRANQESEEIAVTVHLVPDETVNAFATLGGNIFIYQGLLDQLTTEQGLAMVLGHEIAHIHHRDPITTLGRGLAFRIVVTLLTGVAEQGAASALVEATGGSMLLNFSRDQERLADAAALTGLTELYGHAHGADEFFTHIAGKAGVEVAGQLVDVPIFLQTHPGVDERLDLIRSHLDDSDTLGSASLVPAKHETTPLPDFVQSQPD